MEANRRHFLGEIGLSYEDYIRLSIGQLKAISEGYRIRKASQEDNFRRLNWSVINLIAAQDYTMEDSWPIATDRTIEGKQENMGRVVPLKVLKAFNEKMKK